MKKNYMLLTGLMFAFLSLTTINKASAQLYINEFMASNDTAYAGILGDYPDWIEIYNAGSEDVMLGGYYMADDLSDPSAMFQIPDTYPDSVTVPAGGYIVFDANKKDDISVMCLNFKLSGGGEQIGLWDPDQNIIDSLTYGEQTTDMSYGRYPDGSSDWFFMTSYTPGAANQHTTGISIHKKEAALLQNYPNPFSGSTTIAFEIKRAGNVSISVYNLTGKLVQTVADKYFTVGKHTVIWDGNNLPEGVYYYRMNTGNRSVVRKALIVK